MKKTFLAIISLIFCTTVFAQTDAINRVLLHKADGTYQGYKLEQVDSLTFATVEGDVAADITIDEFTLDKAVVTITRTESCLSFKLSCLPAVKANSYSDEYLAQYIDQEMSGSYYEDFVRGEMTGMTFEPNTDYVIATVGIDELGVLCDVRRASFTSPSLPLVGDPKVEYEVTDTQLTSFTVKFTPNSDVSKFSVLAGEKGTIESQFEMFAPMFGYVNMGQMIEGWGVQYTEENSFTWSDMAPNTTFEVYIQAWDLEGTMAPYQMFELSTLALGGEGTAEVAIELGDYILADWWGEMLPSQFITFTPNDQASCYRMAVYTAEVYDADAEAIKADLCSDPWMPTTGWFQYEALTTDYQINPTTECVAIAAAKNVNGEWGPVTELRFTTPETTSDEVQPAAAPSKVIGKRNLTPVNTNLGKLPAVKNSNAVRLIAK